MTISTQTLENKQDVFEHLCAKIYQSILEQQNDLILEQEDWDLLRKANPAHIDKKPEPNY